jgi:uncharacterized protein YutE (UPF0331/DUF86 family)
VTYRPEVVRERLRKLREVVRNLEEVARTPRDSFVRDFRIHWLAERGLLLAAESVFDVGNHILVGRFNLGPSDYEDILRKLGEQGAISRGLQARLRGLGGFRNLLVHSYLDVDPGRVYDHLASRLGDFLEFAREIELFLERPPQAT